MQRNHLFVEDETVSVVPETFDEVNHTVAVCAPLSPLALAQRAVRNADPGEPRSKNCQRCGKPFEPEWRHQIGYWSRCCTVCGARNLFDGLGMTTPPALLDKFTLHPTLIEAEYRKSL